MYCQYFDSTSVASYVMFLLLFFFLSLLFLITLSFGALGGLCFTIVAITKTYLYDFDPLKPHFNIVKLGFTVVYINFLTSAQKHRLWVLVRTASARRF